VLEKGKDHADTWNRIMNRSKEKVPDASVYCPFQGKNQDGEGGRAVLGFREGRRGK
jgi:hypothetical protein